VSRLPNPRRPGSFNIDPAAQGENQFFAKGLNRFSVPTIPLKA
jgi:hypothetical protein